MRVFLRRGVMRYHLLLFHTALMLRRHLLVVAKLGTPLRLLDLTSLLDQGLEVQLLEDRLQLPLLFVSNAFIATTSLYQARSHQAVK